MKQNKVNTQGVYAGLTPAILMMAARGPALDAKLRTVALLAEAAVDRAGSDRIGSLNFPDTVKA